MPDCSGCKYADKSPCAVPCCDCARKYVDYFEMRDHTSYKKEVPK